MQTQRTKHNAMRLAHLYVGGKIGITTVLDYIRKINGSANAALFALEFDMHVIAWNMSNGDDAFPSLAENLSRYIDTTINTR